MKVMMFTRKLTGLATLGLVLGLASAALAADMKYTAQLTAQRGDQLATGRAVWQAQRPVVTLTVFVQGVTSADWATVVVDGQYVGEFEIVDGSGFLTVSNEQEAVVPNVQPGSSIVIYAEDTDRPILYGTFARK
jgi:hypothetical protein